MTGYHTEQIDPLYYTAVELEEYPPVAQHMSENLGLTVIGAHGCTQYNNGGKGWSCYI
jgi:hypothetical protein